MVACSDSVAVWQVPGPRVLRLSMSGQIDGEHLAPGIDLAKLVQHRVPDPPVKRQAVQQHDRRPTVPEMPYRSPTTPVGPITRWALCAMFLTTYLP